MLQRCPFPVVVKDLYELLDGMSGSRQSINVGVVKSMIILGFFNVRPLKFFGCFSKGDCNVREPLVKAHLFNFLVWQLVGT